MSFRSYRSNHWIHSGVESVFGLNLNRNFLLDPKNGCYSPLNPCSRQCEIIFIRIAPDAIILGLHRSTHIGTKSHMPWATAYEVVCGAGCSVLTVRDGDG